MNHSICTIGDFQLIDQILKAVTHFVNRAIIVLRATALLTKVFRVKLRAAETDLMSLEVATLTADFVQMESSALKASAQLQSLDLTELTVDRNVMHADIVSIAGTNVFNAKFEQFATPKSDGSTGRVSLRLGQLRFVLIKRYLDNLNNFVSPIALASESLLDEATEISSEIAAKTTVVDSTKGTRALAAALGAKEGTERQSKTMALLKKLSLAAEGDPARGKGLNEAPDVPKFLLDVRLQAPLILIPVTPESEHALAANLGEVTVTNKFVGNCESEHNETRTNSTAVMDKMHVALSGVRVSRVEFYPGETLVTTVHDIATMNDVVATVDRVVDCKVNAVDGPLEMAVGVLSEAVEVCEAWCPVEPIPRCYTPSETRTMISPYMDCSVFSLAMVWRNKGLSDSTGSLRQNENTPNG